MSTLVSNKQEILQNNLNHTIFSWSKQGGLNPVVVDRAEGVYLYDVDGKRYIDFSSQLMNANIGHGNPRVTEAVVRQMERVSFVYPGMVTEVRGELGRKIAEHCPDNLNKTLFTLGGSEAIENAIKIARFYTGRHKIVSHYRSYHGATLGAISVGGDPRRHPMDAQQAPNVVHVENPYSYRCPWGTDTPEACGEMAARNLEQVILYENPESVAAVLFEGESGSSGCIKYPPLYLKKVREICDKYGILLIIDEVMSGFGRTGKWFAFEHHGIAPDMICMAKGLTSGYLPLGGLVLSDKIASHFNDRVLAGGLTYSAHAAACAAGVETIRIMEEDDLVANAARMGRYVDRKVAELKAKHPSIGDFRNTGLLGAIELVRNRSTKEPLTPWNAKPDQMEPTNRMVAKVRELGMFTFVRWNWIFIAPPLIIDEAQVDEGMDILSQVISIADEYYRD